MVGPVGSGRCCTRPIMCGTDIPDLPAGPTVYVLVLEKTSKHNTISDHMSGHMRTMRVTPLLNRQTWRSVQPALALRSTESSLPAAGKLQHRVQHSEYGCQQEHFDEGNHDRCHLLFVAYVYSPLT